MRRRPARLNVTSLLLFIILCEFICTAPAAAPLTRVNQWTRFIHSGVVYTHHKMRVGNSPLHIYELRISLDSPELEIRPILANERLDSLETVPSMAKRNGALAAINGSFFNRQESDPFPVGFLMIDGRTLYFSHLHRSAFGLTADKIPLFGYPRTQGIIWLEKSGEYFYLWGMNGHRSKDEVLVYTPEYGRSTGTNQYGRELIVSNDRVIATRYGDSAIPENGFVLSMHGESKKYFEWFDIGDIVKLYFVVDPAWLDVHNAITGGPMLVKGGRNVVNSEKTASEKLKHGYRERIPVTAIGQTADGKLLLVVVDGRQRNFSVGLTYRELADFMLSIGAVNAIGMDGGGSSTMWIDGSTVNRPSDGSCRPVSNALGLFVKE